MTVAIPTNKLSPVVAELYIPGRKVVITLLSITH